MPEVLEPPDSCEVTRRAAGASLVAPPDPHTRTVTAHGAVAGKAPRDDRVPRRIGRFEISGTLGEGGMGVVYAARDPLLDRPVALKVVRSSRRDRAARLVREAQALARVAHPNVVQVFEVGSDLDGRVYVAMERVDGVTLAAWLEARRRTPAEIVAVFRQAARGLAAAHAAGLVHRDFKPENVMLGDDGRVRLLDFGIARAAGAGRDADEPPGAAIARGISPAMTLTSTRSVVGTPHYMSPEQWTGGAIDPRADQFAFAVALYRALTGLHPFDDTTSPRLRETVLAGEVRTIPAALPASLRAVLTRGLAPRPDDRFPDMTDVLAALAARPPWWRRAVVAVASTLGLALGALAARA